MKHRKISEQSWYPYAVAICLGVLLYVLLEHISNIWGAVSKISGYFLPVLLGCVLAYLMNPLAKLYERKLFRKVKKPNLGWSLSVALAFITVVAFLLFLLGTLVPQLIDSITTLVSNVDSYLATLKKLLERWGLAKHIDLDSVLSSSGDLVSKIADWLSKNLSNIVSASSRAGKGVANWVIALVLSVYLLAAKEPLKLGVHRLARATMSKPHLDYTQRFLTRCDSILSRYITFSLLDALIIGFANLIFMWILGMQYAGLVSVVVGFTNLIPTFGPIIGAVIGGLILLLVKPVHALIFVIFTLVLQTIDGYVIKPRLFGNSLGVSCLLILVAIVVGGNIFGVVGILLAIPFAAILDFVYKEAFLPWLEARGERRQKEKPESK